MATCSHLTKAKSPPDTDIYNIGLSLLEMSLSNKSIVVQINVPHKEKKYLYLNSLLQKVRRDSDLASISTNTVGKILQTVFIVSGCDYIIIFQWVWEGHCPGLLLPTCQICNRTRVPWDSCEY